MFFILLLCFFGCLYWCVKYNSALIFLCISEGVILMSNDTDSPDSLCSGGFLAAISAAALGMAYYGSRFFF